MSNPKVRFIGRYGTYRVGDVIAPPAGLRKVLLNLGRAVMVEPVSPKSTPRPRKK